MEDDTDASQIPAGGEALGPSQATVRRGMTIRRRCMEWVARMANHSGPMWTAVSMMSIDEGTEVSEEESRLQPARLELALWQESYFERRSSQYDSAISNILVVAGLVSAASAAVLALQPNLSSTAGWLVASSVTSIMASVILLAPSLVKSKYDENVVDWSGSKAVADPVARHISVVDARSRALAEHLGYRMGLVYTGFALAILGGGCLVLYLMFGVALPLILR